MTAEEIYNFIDGVYKNGTPCNEYVSINISGYDINCRRIHMLHHDYYNAYHMIVLSDIKLKHSANILKTSDGYHISDIEQDDNPVTNPLGNSFKSMTVDNFFELWKPLMREIKLNKIINENI